MGLIVLAAIMLMGFYGLFFVVIPDIVQKIRKHKSKS